VAPANAIPPPLPEDEFDAVFARVPRLTVEVVITSPAGVLLTRRRSGPCRGLWHLPGGTVRLGEPLTDAVVRVGREELDLDVAAEGLLGYIEYPSHLRGGLGWPVGIAFRAVPRSTWRPQPGLAEWFSRLPAEEMHEEQVAFLTDGGGGVAAGLLAGVRRRS
jgi:ADP-ribose pyrophosphatase YjhB (NUDIX family)